MSGAKVFLDTNVVLYLMSPHDAKADRCVELLAIGGTISVQVLNEFVAVATRKFKMPLTEIRDVLAQVRSACSVESMSLATHDRALAVSERYRLHVYDSLIVASALLAGCRILYSEDMQDGQLIERMLTIRNPFKTAAK